MLSPISTLCLFLMGMHRVKRPLGHNDWLEFQSLCNLQTAEPTFRKVGRSTELHTFYKRRKKPSLKWGSNPWPWDTCAVYIWIHVQYIYGHMSSIYMDTCPVYIWIHVQYIYMDTCPVYIWIHVQYIYVHMSSITTFSISSILHRLLAKCCSALKARGDGKQV